MTVRLSTRVTQLKIVGVGFLLTERGGGGG